MAPRKSKKEMKEEAKGEAAKLGVTDGVSEQVIQALVEEDRSGVPRYSLSIACVYLGGVGWEKLAKINDEVSKLSKADRKDLACVGTPVRQQANIRSKMLMNAAWLRAMKKVHCRLHRDATKKDQDRMLGQRLDQHYQEVWRPYLIEKANGSTSIIEEIQKRLLNALMTIPDTIGRPDPQQQEGFDVRLLTFADALSMHWLDFEARQRCHRQALKWLDSEKAHFLRLDAEAHEERLRSRMQARAGRSERSRDRL